MSRTRALLGPSTVMATGTVVSRITGIARDIALAAALGFYLVSDAYSLGNSLPTIIYILVVGGASTPYSFRSWFDGWRRTTTEVTPTPTVSSH